MNPQNLTDNELLINTENLVKKERECTLVIINHIEEIHRRRLYCDLGYGSIFYYLTNHLGDSPAQAQRRINAARLISDVPEVKEKIQSGQLPLSGVAQIQTHIQQESKTRNITIQEKNELIDKASGKSVRQIERMLVESSSKKDPGKESKRMVKGKRVKLSFSLDEDKYERLQKLMHEKGIGSMEELIAELVEDKPQKEIRERKNVPPSHGRHIPAKVKREVFKRDNGKCTICGSTTRLNFDHKNPYAKGGTSGVENIRILCASCNQRQAIIQFGRKKMYQYLNPTS